MLLFLRLPTLLAKWWRRSLGQDREAKTGSRRNLSFIVFRLDALGDAVMTTPIFRELKRSFPGSRCTVVVPEACRSLFVTNPHVDEILAVPVIAPRCFPERPRRLLAAFLVYWRFLKTRQYDVAISPRWDTDEHLATFLCLVANAAIRAGYTERTSAAKSRLNRGFDGAFDLCLPAGLQQHEVLRNLAVVDALGGSVEDTCLDIRLTSRDRRRAEHGLRKASPSATLVALGIGAQSAGRRWPLQCFAETIAGLEQFVQVQPVIVCSPAERVLASHLARLMSTPPIVLIQPQLRDVCAVLERCNLFIGNDSGPAHLAAAMDCPVLVVSRHPSTGDPDHPNSPARFAPHCRTRRVLQPKRAVDPCTSGCNALEPHCITSVSVADVVAAALELLGSALGATARPVAVPNTTELFLSDLQAREHAMFCEGRA